MQLQFIHRARYSPWENLRVMPFNDDVKHVFHVVSVNPESKPPAQNRPQAKWEGQCRCKNCKGIRGEVTDGGLPAPGGPCQIRRDARKVYARLGQIESAQRAWLACRQSQDFSCRALSPRAKSFLLPDILARSHSKGKHRPSSTESACLFISGIVPENIYPLAGAGLF